MFPPVGLMRTNGPMRGVCVCLRERACAWVWGLKQACMGHQTEDNLDETAMDGNNGTKPSKVSNPS